MNNWQISKLLIKLNRQTKENLIEWNSNRSSPNSLGGSEILIGIVYITVVLGKSLQLYKFQTPKSN